MKNEFLAWWKKHYIAFGEYQGLGIFDEKPSIIEEEQRLKSRFRMTLDTLWDLTVQAVGFVFRAVFIITVGVVCYEWIDPQDISNIPIGQLTFDDVLTDIYALFILLACLYWLFHPNQSSEKPYEMWTNILALIILSIVAYLLIR